MLHSRGHSACTYKAAALALAVVLLAVPAAMAQRPYGADFSHWNGDVTQAQWDNLYANGWVFGWTKATESPFYWNTRTCAGSWYNDNTFVNNMTRAKNAGIFMGAYHFAHPQCYTAAYEADGFVDVAGPYISGGYFRPCLDLEDGSSLTTTALSNWVNDFMDEMEILTGIEPVLYTNTSYCMYELDSTVAGRDLWVAQYLYEPFDEQTDNPSIGVFSTWKFWQYSDNGTLPGLTGSHDVNVFNGVASGLTAYVIPGGTQPPFVVESRSGGQNYANYSETGTWSSGTSKSTAPLCTSGIGHRWCTINSTAKTAVFRYTPQTTGTYEIFTTNCTTTNSGNPLIHKVTHTGGTTNVGVCQNTTCGSNAVNVWYSLGQYTLNSGTQYNVTLDGSTGAGSLPADNAGRSDAIKWVLVSTGGPTITAHPAAQNVCSGSNASFSVSATGQGTLTYQWQKAQVNITNGGKFSGCTTATLTVTGATSSEAANYRCVVTDSTGSTTSNEAALTIKAATAITTHPQNQSVTTGGTANFTVAASGSGTLTYQWQKNSVNVTNGGHYSGCTTATLTISSADSNDAANYRCVVTAGCGSATSNQASLTVTTVQTIINDQFSYADQTAFQTAWPPVGTSLALSTAAYYSSPKSLYSASGSTARQNKKTFSEVYGTTASPLTLQFRFYDPGTTGTVNQWVDIRDYSPVTQKQLVQFGLYSGTSTTKYSCRVTFTPGTGWLATSVNRSTGWHLMKVVFKDTTCDFYVDGVLAASNRAYASSVGAVSFEEMRVGSGYASTSVAAYYDDVLLQKGQ